MFCDHYLKCVQLHFDLIQSFFQDTIKQLQEELKSIEEAENLCVSFTDWFSSTQKNFTALTDTSEPLDRPAMEKKIKKLEVSIHLLKSVLYLCGDMFSQPKL